VVPTVAETGVGREDLRLGDHLSGDRVLVQVLGLSRSRHGAFESFQVERLGETVGFDGSCGCDEYYRSQAEERMGLSEKSWSTARYHKPVKGGCELFLLSFRPAVESRARD